jgi:hypothetical protein
MVVVKRTEMVLMDRPALAEWTRRSVRVIRQHCVVIEYDSAGRALYDARASADLLLTVPQRRPRVALTKR